MSDQFEKDQQLSLAKDRTVLANERTRLANQRTFLSWIRTGLASVGGGIAVIRLLYFENPSHQAIAKSVGFLLVLLGVGIFLVSFYNFKIGSKSLQAENGGHQFLFWYITLMVIVLCLASLLLLMITFV